MKILKKISLYFTDLFVLIMILWCIFLVLLCTTRYGIAVFGLYTLLLNRMAKMGYLDVDKYYSNPDHLDFP